MTVACPTNEALARYLRGESTAHGSGASGVEIEAHLQACPRCEQVLAKMSDDQFDWPQISAAAKPPNVPADDRDDLEESFSRVRGQIRNLAGQFNRPPQFPGYDVIEEIGSGSAAVVYRARQHDPPREVAIKMLRLADRTSQIALARFRAEIDTIAQLNHPNVVPIHQVGEFEGTIFYTMPFLQGGSLASRLDGAPWDSQQAATLIRDLCRAVSAAHRVGVIHRDIKPGNVLLEQTPRDDRSDSNRCELIEWIPKLADFGIAKTNATECDLTQTGEIVGTPSYMAPEQIRGELELIGPQTDVYALGAILYELLTGRPPFRGKTATETMFEAIHNEPLPPDRLHHRLPLDLSTICLKSLAKRVGERYRTADELADELDRFLSGKPILASPASALERTIKWTRRHPAAAATVGVCLAAILALLGTWANFTWKLKIERDNVRKTAKRLEEEKALNLANFDRAFEAIRRYLQAVQSSPQLANDEFVELRKEILETGTSFYTDLLANHSTISQLPSARVTTERVHLEQARVYFTLGKLCYATEDFQKSLECFSTAEQICRSILGDDFVPSQAADAGLPGALWLSQCKSRLALGQLEQAEAAARKGLAYFENLLSRDLLSTDYENWYLAESWLRLGEVNKELGGVDDAEQNFRRALEFAKQLPPVPDFQLTRTQVLMGIGSCLILNQQLTRGREQLTRAVTIIEEVCDRLTDNSRYLPMLAETQWSLARCLHLMANPEVAGEAESRLRAAIEIQRKLASSKSTSNHVRVVLAEMLRDLSDWLAIGGNLSESREVAREADLVSATPTANK